MFRFIDKNSFFRWWSRVDRAFLVHKRLGVFMYSTPFHLVTPSIWPFVISLIILIFIVSFASGIHGFAYTAVGIKLSFTFLVWGVFRWWQDIVYEGFIQGWHTDAVRRGLRIGVVLFIFSEIMFFAAFFWAFFHSSLAPTCEIGCGWPPVRGVLLGVDGKGVIAASGALLFNPWLIPFLNTLLLLGSGAWLTYGHAVVQWRRSTRFLSRYSVVQRMFLGSLLFERNNSPSEKEVNSKSFFRRVYRVLLFAIFVPYVLYRLVCRNVYIMGTFYFSGRQK